jgi:hypothetical protein
MYSSKKAFRRLYMLRGNFIPQLRPGDILHRNGSPANSFVRVVTVGDGLFVTRGWDKKKRDFSQRSRLIEHTLDGSLWKKFYILSFPLHEKRDPPLAVGQVWRRKVGKYRSRWDCRKVLEVGDRGLKVRNCTIDEGGHVVMGPTTSNTLEENFLKVYEHVRTPAPMFVPDLTLLRVRGATRNSYMVVEGYDSECRAITLATWDPKKKAVKNFVDGGRVVTAFVNRSFWEGFELWSYKQG